MKTPVIIAGCAGRMGKTLVQRACALKTFSVVGGTEMNGSPVLGQDVGVVAGVSRLGVNVQNSLSKVTSKGVVIDFTFPETTLAHVKIAVENKIPLVIGSTGFTPAQKKKIIEASKKIPIVMSSNMSMGVNTMVGLLELASKILADDYDIEITEAHHRLKKDAPSGTAIMLAEAIAAVTGKNYPKDFNFSRHGLTGERKKGEIGMQVIRGGDIVGEHSVFYCGTGEQLEIRHVATNRATFADGALKAAAFLSKKKNGFYNMQDVLGLK